MLQILIRLQIVSFCRLVTVASLGAVEVCAAQRHGVNVSLVSVTVFRGSPRVGVTMMCDKRQKR